MNPEARDAAGRGRFEGHIITWWNALHQRVELWSCRDAPARAFLGARPGADPSDHRGIFRVEGVYDEALHGIFTYRCSGLCFAGLEQRHKSGSHIDEDQGPED